MKIKQITKLTNKFDRYDIEVEHTHNFFANNILVHNCRGTIDQENNALSRKNKPWITIPHILEVLAPLFNRFPELKLDGEIYNYDLRQDLGELIHIFEFF